ncbi:hypothetical protein [Salinigranum halophilum]|jgi:hypothetical protein|uniref:hypothetical protein n=1 Tax=Salinigranum halophilum TaxID=2565931 RepID=UPI00115F3A66|nr:hypothetical protein [Salinigranum halophilum]
MSDADPDHDGETDSGATRQAADADEADTFGVGIHVTDEEFQFVVHVPSSIGSGWTDPEAFQRLVERVVWDHLEQESTLREIAVSATTGETVTLGTVTLLPDGTVVDHTLSAPGTREGATDGGGR